MFFIKMRSRDSANASVHIFARGTPRKVTSERESALSSGHVES